MGNWEWSRVSAGSVLPTAAADECGLAATRESVSRACAAGGNRDNDKSCGVWYLPEHAPDSVPPDIANTTSYFPEHSKRDIEIPQDLQVGDDSVVIWQFWTVSIVLSFIKTQLNSTQLCMPVRTSEKTCYVSTTSPTG
jgi:hypothetical protein